MRIDTTLTQNSVGRTVPRPSIVNVQVPNDRYENVEISGEDRLRKALKGGAIGALVGAAIPALTIPVLLLTKNYGELSSALKMTLTGAVGVGALFAGSEALAAKQNIQGEVRASAQAEAVALARSIRESESPTADLWKSLETVRPISTEPGLSRGTESQVLAILRSLQERGTEFGEGMGPSEALRQIEDGKPLKLRNQGQREITSLQGLLAFDVTRGAGLVALPARIKQAWDRCERVGPEVTGSQRRDPRDAMESLIAKYSGPRTDLPYPTADLRTFSDVEHLDFLEKGGEPPSLPHPSLAMLERLADKGFELLSYDFERVWKTPAFTTYCELRDGRASQQLLGTPAGRIPIWADNALDKTVREYEQIGLEKLVTNFQLEQHKYSNSSLPFRSLPEDSFLQRLSDSADWKPEVKGAGMLSGWN